MPPKKKIKISEPLLDRHQDVAFDEHDIPDLTENAANRVAIADAGGFCAISAAMTADDDGCHKTACDSLKVIAGEALDEDCNGDDFARRRMVMRIPTAVMMMTMIATCRWPSMPRVARAIITLLPTVQPAGMMKTKSQLRLLAVSPPLSRLCKPTQMIWS